MCGFLDYMEKMEVDNPQAKQKYAVVKFLVDSTYSEIPTSWLIEHDNIQQCWWPPRTAKLHF